MAKVWLVGAGPGAPDLLTLRAARLLAEADIVFFDALVHPDTVALAARARKVAVGKRCGQVSADQNFINAHLVEAAREYSQVVRLKGGDPMLFGRAQEEIAELEAAGIDYEVVPGVTAALAAAASLGVSLTRRGVARSVTFATPSVGRGEDPQGNDWAQSAARADTTLLYMAGSHAAAHAQSLIAAGRDGETPVVWIENASLPTEEVRSTTLAQLASASASHHSAARGPALLCIGEVFRDVACAARPLQTSTSMRMRPEADQAWPVQVHTSRCPLN